MFVFGKSADEIDELRRGGYRPQTFIEQDPELRRVIQTIAGLADGDYRPIVDVLTSATAAPATSSAKCCGITIACSNWWKAWASSAAVTRKA